MSRCLRYATVVIAACVATNCEPASKATQPEPQRLAPNRGPLRVGGDVKAPIVIKRVEPTYPESLKRQIRQPGMIALEGVITKEGKVRDLRIIRGSDDALAPYVLAAVEQWEFSPATRNGDPVDVIYDVSTYIHVR